MYILNVHTGGNAKRGTMFGGYYLYKFLPKVMLTMIWIMFVIVPAISILVYTASVVYSIYYVLDISPILNAWFLMYPLINVLNILSYYVLISTFKDDVKAQMEADDEEYNTRLEDQDEVMFLTKVEDESYKYE